MSVWQGDARVALHAKEDAGITGGAWLVRGTSGDDQAGEVKDWSTFFEGVPEDEVSPPRPTTTPLYRAESDVEQTNKRRSTQLL
jgi:hypothetical protein